MLRPPPPIPPSTSEARPPEPPSAPPSSPPPAAFAWGGRDGDKERPSHELLAVCGQGALHALISHKLNIGKTLQEGRQDKRGR